MEIKKELTKIDAVWQLTILGIGIANPSLFNFKNSFLVAFLFSGKTIKLCLYGFEWK